MLGDFNCNMVFRQSRVMPDIVVYSDEARVVMQVLITGRRAHKYFPAHRARANTMHLSRVVVMQPLGEPGLALGPRHAGRAVSDGSVASSLCTSAHSLHTVFTNILGTSVSETTMRPDPSPTSWW